jgi:hypothetical protein
METSQGNTLNSYLKQIKMSFYYFTEMENRKAKCVMYGGVGISGRG